MRIPSNWNQITIEQFQECYFLLGKNPDIDTWVRVLSTLTGKPDKFFYELPIKLEGNKLDLKKCIAKLQFLLNPNLNEKVNKYVAFKGRPYKACLFANEMQTNQVADLKAFMVSEGQSVNDTIVENAHKLLACIYIPLTLNGFKYVPSKHKEVAEKFKKAKMGDVYGTLFFYSRVYKDLIQTTNIFLENQKEIVEKHMKEELLPWAQKQNLIKDGAGR